jgi:enoyl-CoA hydratase
MSVHEPPLLYDARDGVATITLNRPEQRNALDLTMCEALLAAARAAAADGALRLVFVRGAGSAFCAGADLKERRAMDGQAVLARRLRALFAYEALEQLPMPVVALVDGAAVGSGVEITAACDFAIATSRAQFWTPEALWGTVGATQRLARIVGRRLAKDMMFSGRRLDAAAALRAGLVTRVVEPHALDDAARALADTLAQAPPLAVRLAKRCIDRSVQSGGRGALAEELLAIEDNLAGSDWRAGIAGFGEKA